MKYCIRCVLPDTRPNLAIGADGVCSACRNHGERPSVDWVAREKVFRELLQDVKRRAGNSWDCVIPVSGGKDSTWQVVTALEYGLKPLCVTWKSPGRNELGQKNLENLVRLGVDHVDLTINPELERKFTLSALKKKGSPAVPMHMAIFGFPINIAVRFGIPLVLWGENSAQEYGGGDGRGLGASMSREWLLRYGVTNGTTAEDWADKELSVKDLAPYQWPTDKDLEKSGVKAAFLGHYFVWDPVKTFEVAKKHGFEASSSGALTGIYDFADVDDSFLITIHHWIKWLKFGFTRSWDNLSLEIRNGRTTREEAIQLLQKRGNEYPAEAIGKFCEWAKISKSEFDAIVEPFRNLKIWSKNSAGEWVLPGFLLQNWRWS